MDDFELELKTTFIEEAMLNLEEVEGCFMALESSSDTKGLLDQIFRLAHNLKGGSRSVGFGDVAEFTHQLESLVLAIQKGKIQLSTPIVSTLLHANDRLVEMIAGLKSDINSSFENNDLITEMKNFLDAAPSVELPVAVAEEVESLVSVSAPPEEVKVTLLDDAPPSASSFFDIPEESQSAEAASHSHSDGESSANTEGLPGTPQKEAEPEIPVKNNAESSKNKPTRSPAGAGKPEKDDEVVRVNLSRIELLNDYVGELIVLQSVIQQQSISGNTLKLQGSIQQMVKLSKDVQNIAMGLRMLPVKPLIQKLQRVVRDTSTTLFKKVHLELFGDHIDVDKSVLDQISDPLIHILRNAVDHGVEMPQERVAAGKPEEGKVRLFFYNEGNHLIIEITDDGKGIDTEVIRRKATEKGLIKEADALSDKQIINLIFHAGFSTKEVTTEVSGRGVGMDVVKTNVEKFGGQIEITSEKGRGSNFRLKIPLSLSVIEGLVTKAGKNRYVIPLSQVQETVNLGAIKIFQNKIGIGDCMEIRGQVVPIYMLEDLVEARRSEKQSSDSTALLFNVGERTVAVSVTDLLHSQQVVIKPIDNGLKKQAGWVGSCILGDGLPALIVSPVDLLAGKITSAMNLKEKGIAA